MRMRLSGYHMTVVGCCLQTEVFCQCQGGKEDVIKTCQNCCCENIYVQVRLSSAQQVCCFCCYQMSTSPRLSEI